MVKISRSLQCVITVTSVTSHLSYRSQLFSCMASFTGWTCVCLSLTGGPLDLSPNATTSSETRPRHLCFYRSYGANCLEEIAWPGSSRYLSCPCALSNNPRVHVTCLIALLCACGIMFERMCAFDVICEPPPTEPL